MRFDKCLRGSTLKPYPVGYMAPPTDGFNGEDPRCQLGGIKDGGQWLDDQALPSIIELQISLTPVWIEDETASAYLSGYSPSSLYAPKSAISILRVTYTGTGRYQKISGDTMIPFIGKHLSSYTLDLPQPYLYQKEFLHQEGRQIQWTPQEGKQGAILPLWSYGGQQIGDDVHPSVCTVEALRDTTQVTPSSLLYWREQGISPFQGGLRGREEVTFQDVFSIDQTRTFQESIEAGIATFLLGLGADERGDLVSIPYSSYRLSKTCLYFKKGEQ